MASDPMLRAIELASGHRAHPNPRVGSVVLQDGENVGEGAHRGPGSSHAEVEALAAAGESARGATLYVTLEPCSHHGRTPPCVDSIIAAGVSRVFVGAVDPDHRVAGTGIAALEAAGIDVEMWSEPVIAESVDPAYFHHRRTGMPRVTAKWAMTLDGAAAAQDGSSQWITSEAAREDAHRLRATMDAVVVGAGTLRADDPLLDVRLDGYSGPQPRPVVVAGSEKLPVDARLWAREPLVLSAVERQIPAGELVIIAGLEDLPEPTGAAQALSEHGLLDVMIEGGPTLLSAWSAAGLISRAVVYIGARVAGGKGIGPMGGVFANIADAADVDVVDVQMVGRDVRIEFQ